MDNEPITPAQPAPPLNVPPSKSTVKVSVIDTTSRFKIPIGALLQPEYEGKPWLTGPSFSFLIEHKGSKAVLFDLGIRLNWEIFPRAPMWKDKGWDIIVEKDVATILRENNVDVDGGAIGSVILSHHHWDHLGDLTTFPSLTEVVVGPGFIATHLPGYPHRQDTNVIDADFHGKDMREVDFDKPPKGDFRIGRFKALDFFGDGSFFLLDTPGHSRGHICGFARTSSAPDSFVFMGGDACHHGGEFRPTVHLPLPKDIKPSPFKDRPGACPGHLLQGIHPEKAVDKPFLQVTETFPDDGKELADWTIDGLGEFDAQDNVLVLLAHDDAVVDPPQFDFYPKSINNWYQQDVGRKTKWLFLADFVESVAAVEQGKAPFVRTTK